MSNCINHLARAALVFLSLIVLKIILIGMLFSDEVVLFLFVLMVIVILSGVMVYELAVFVSSRLVKKDDNDDWDS